MIWAAGISCWIFSFIYGFHTGEWMWPLITFLISKIVVIPANHICMHRYLTHRSFVTTKPMHKFLCYSTVLLGAGPPTMYISGHRHHHRHSDEELDIHSPVNSVVESLGLWEIKPVDWFVKTKKMKLDIRDWIKDPTFKFIHNNYFKIWGVMTIIALLLGVLVSWKIPVFILFGPVGWYIFGSGVFITTISHIKTPWSYRNFETSDNSQNNKWVHWYTMGEGLHNNHHAKPNEYNQAMAPGEFDIAGWIVENYVKVDPNSEKAYKV